MKRKRLKSRKGAAGHKSAGESRAGTSPTQIKSGMTVDQLKSLTKARLCRNPQGAPSSGLRPGMSVEDLKRLTGLRLVDITSAGGRASRPAGAASGEGKVKATGDRAKIDAEVQRVRAYIAAGQRAAKSQGKATKTTQLSPAAAAAAAVSAAALASVEPSGHEDRV